MDRTRRRRQPSAAGDRLSKLEDRVLGHVLSFLQAKEAARAALLSSRWRDVFAAVRTVSMDEPEPEGAGDSRTTRGAEPPTFSCAVSNALLARNRRGGTASLRALRVAMDDGYRSFPFGAHATTVDQWISYALHQAAAAPEGLQIDLRLRRGALCYRPYALAPSSRKRPRTLSDAGSSDSEGEELYHRRRRVSISGASSGYDEPRRSPASRSRSGRPSDGSLSPSDSDGSRWYFDGYDTDRSPSQLRRRKETARAGSARPWETAPYTVPSSLFSCADLRSLALSHCRLAPPAKVSLPSLETLLLSHVTDPGRRVAGIIAGCPRLADLTLEACEEVVRLYVPSAARLRRLALRCCHRLHTVVVDDASELAAFEYRGPVPDTSSFLTMHGGGSKKVAYCRVDICGEEEASSEKLVRLRQLLRLFSNTRRLHLESARLGSGFDTDAFRSFSTMPRLRHLELRGRLPDDDAVVVDSLGRILGHAPKLEVLTLVFHPEEHDLGARPDRYNFTEEELLDAHHLRYNPHSDLAVPSSTIRCLRKRVREINLVHYQGGRAQRTLAKFLLCNAPVMDNLCCVFAEGPLWTQTQLKREILGWVRNKSANTQFF
ncbi:hypothetical protein BS78_09G116200 [Paspalum vaginatum]|nr:hypothetical protein BS78_09G116200 [Paspalum vaginatum]